MRQTLLTIILIGGLLISCRSVPEQNLLPDIDVPPESTSTFVKLVDSPSMQNSHKNDELLLLDLINLSDETIIFPSDFGIKIVTKSEQSWTDVINAFYYAEQQNYLPTKAEYPLGQLVTVLPYIEGMSSPTVIRIIVVGQIKDQPDNLVAAYIDIELIP